MNCPTCASPDVRSSKRSSWDGAVPFRGAQQPYRCRSCRVRFFIAEPQSEPAAKPARSSHHRRSSSGGLRRTWKKLMKGQARRRLINVAIFASSMALFLALLYLVIIRMGTREEPTAQLQFQLPGIERAARPSV